MVCLKTAEILLVFLIVILAAGCTATPPGDPARQTLTPAEGGIHSGLPPATQMSGVLPATTQQTFLSASLAKPSWKTGETITIHGEATGTPPVTIVVHRILSQNPSQSDPAFAPRTYQGVVQNGRYSLLLNPAELGPGEFQAVVSMPSTGQYTNIRFVIEG